MTGIPESAVDHPSLDSSTTAGMKDSTSRTILGRRTILSRRLTNALWLIGVLAAWEILGRTVGGIVLPPASQIANAWLRLASDGSLAEGLGPTSTAFLLGLPLGLLVGIVSGLALGYWPKLDEFCAPFLNGFLAMPSVGYIPIIIVWLGFGVEARAAIVFEFVVFVLAVNVLTGVKTVEPALIEMARSFGLDKPALFRRVIVPAAFPAISAGIRMSLGRAVKGAINAELLMTFVGLGGMLKYYGGTFQTDYLWAIVVTLAVIALLLTAAWNRFDTRVNAWRPNA